MHCYIVFQFCHMFQIKRLNSACLVLYLHRKSNTTVLMYVMYQSPIVGVHIQQITLLG